MCAACWCRKVDGDPWCELCIHHLSSAGGNIALAVTFLFLSLGIAAAGIRWQSNPADDVAWLIWATVGVGGVLGALYLGTRVQPKIERQIEVRRGDEPPPPSKSAAIGHPYRAALRRAAHIAASPLSGRWTAGLLIACMFVVAVAVPWLLRLPRWIEAEVVLSLWWVSWAAILTTLLYRGWRISDDHVLATPHFPRTGRTASGDGRARGCAQFAGCGEELIGMLVLIAAFAVAWLVVELIVPAMVFLSYLLVRGALARVANDDHECKGRLSAALSWGVTWATVYALPLALVIYGVHRWLGPAVAQ